MTSLDHVEFNLTPQSNPSRRMNLLQVLGTSRRHYPCSYAHEHRKVPSNRASFRASRPPYLVGTGVREEWRMLSPAPSE